MLVFTLQLPAGVVIMFQACVGMRLPRWSVPEQDTESLPAMERANLPGGGISNKYANKLEL